MFTFADTNWNTSGDSSDDYFCDEKVSNSSSDDLIFTGSSVECQDPCDVWERLENDSTGLTEESLIAMLI